jgi:hypothetical protein
MQVAKGQRFDHYTKMPAEYCPAGIEAHLTFPVITVSSLQLHFLVLVAVIIPECPYLPFLGAVIMMVMSLPFAACCTFTNITCGMPGGK